MHSKPRKANRKTILDAVKSRVAIDDCANLEEAALRVAELLGMPEARQKVKEKLSELLRDSKLILHGGQLAVPTEEQLAVIERQPSNRERRRRMRYRNDDSHHGYPGSRRKQRRRAFGDLAA